MGWLAGWSHRKTVTITGQSGAGTNYQVNLSIGDASGGDFHLENHCTSFPNDITVTDNDQTSLLDHWVEDLTVDPISMWVEVADDLGSNADVCVYYTKSGESSASDINTTFLFGDDFPNSSIDTNKWTVTGNGISVSGGIATLTTSATNTQNRLESITSWSKNNQTIIAARTKTQYFNSQSYGEQSFGLPAGPVTAEYNHRYADWGGTYSTTASITGWSANVWHIQELKRPSKWDWYVDYANYVEDTTAYQTGDYPIWFRADYNTNPAIMYVDWVIVREYNDPEPAFSSVGSEESAPVGAIISQLQKTNLGADLYNGALIT